MSSCCVGSRPLSHGIRLCPVSGTNGSLVERQTVKAVLTTAALRRLTPAAHRFCPDPACDIVYFAEDGHTYSTADIQVRVWQKEPYGDRVICYCFGENDAAIEAEIEAHGQSDAVRRVREHIQAGRCACDVRNPRGTCCLGDLTAAVNRAADALTSEEIRQKDGSSRWKPTRRTKSASLQPEAD